MRSSPRSQISATMRSRLRASGPSRPPCISQRSARRCATAGRGWRRPARRRLWRRRRAGRRRPARALARRAGRSARRRGSAAAAGERPGDRDALGLAAGDLLGQPVGELAQVEPVEQLRAGPAPRRPRSRPAASGSATFSSTVRAAAGSAPGRPPRPARAAASSPDPRPRHGPAVGVSSPASRCSSVVLPEPDGPTSAIRAPPPTSQSSVAARPSASRRGPKVRAAPSQRTSGSIAASRPSRSGSRGRRARRDRRRCGSRPARRRPARRARAAASRTCGRSASSSSPVGSSASTTGGRGERHRQPGARQLPAGELGAAGVRAAAMPAASSSLDDVLRVGPARRRSRRATRDVAGDRQVGDQVRALEEHADVARAQPGAFLLAARESRSPATRPCRRPGSSSPARQASSVDLPGAGRPGDRDELAGRDAQATPPAAPASRRRRRGRSGTGCPRQHGRSRRPPQRVA